MHILAEQNAKHLHKFPNLLENYVLERKKKFVRMQNLKFTG